MVRLLNGRLSEVVMLDGGVDFSAAVEQGLGPLVVNDLACPEILNGLQVPRVP